MDLTYDRMLPWQKMKKEMESKVISWYEIEDNFKKFTDAYRQENYISDRELDLMKTAFFMGWVK
jgi:hypothetical protein